MKVPAVISAALQRRSVGELLLLLLLAVLTIASIAVEGSSERDVRAAAAVRVGQQARRMSERNAYERRAEHGPNTGNQLVAVEGQPFSIALPAHVVGWRALSGPDGQVWRPADGTFVRLAPVAAGADDVSNGLLSGGDPARTSATEVADQNALITFDGLSFSLGGTFAIHASWINATDGAVLREAEASFQWPQVKVVPRELKLGFLTNRARFSLLVNAFVSSKLMVTVINEGSVFRTSMLPNTTMTVVAGISDCNAATGVEVTLKQILEDNVMGFVGPVCASVTTDIATLAGVFRRMVITPFSQADELSDRMVYPYFMRTGGYVTLQNNALVSLCLSMGWRYVSIMHIASVPVGADTLELLAAAGIEVDRVVLLPNTASSATTKVTADQMTVVHNAIAQLRSSRSRVFLGILFSVSMIIDAIIEAGLFGPEYTWILRPQVVNPYVGAALQGRYADTVWAFNKQFLFDFFAPADARPDIWADLEEVWNRNRTITKVAAGGVDSFTFPMAASLRAAMGVNLPVAADATLAFGHAAHEVAYVRGERLTPQRLADAMLDLAPFEGLSGPVVYEPGSPNRQLAVAVFQLQVSPRDGGGLNLAKQMLGHTVPEQVESGIRWLPGVVPGETITFADGSTAVPLSYDCIPPCGPHGNCTARDRCDCYTGYHLQRGVGSGVDIKEGEADEASSTGLCVKARTDDTQGGSGTSTGVVVAGVCIGVVAVLVAVVVARITTRRTRAGAEPWRLDYSTLDALAGEQAGTSMSSLPSSCGTQTERNATAEQPPFAPGVSTSSRKGAVNGATRAAARLQQPATSGNLRVQTPPVARRQRRDSDSHSEVSFMSRASSAGRSGGLLKSKAGVSGDIANWTVPVVNWRGLKVVLRVVEFRQRSSADKSGKIDWTRDQASALGAAYAIRHANVASFMGVALGASAPAAPGEANGTPHVPGLRRAILLSELMASGSLLDVLVDSSVPLDTRLRHSFARDLVYGMAYLHKIGVRHGRLTPSNCLVDSHLNCKVSDFWINAITGRRDIHDADAAAAAAQRESRGDPKAGVAEQAAVSECADVSVMVSLGAAGGVFHDDVEISCDAERDSKLLPPHIATFAEGSYRLRSSIYWTAPELLADPLSPVSEATDVYSAGMVLFMLTQGHVPFIDEGGLSDAEMVRRIVHDHLRPTPVRGAGGVSTAKLPHREAYARVLTMCALPEGDNRPVFAVVARELADVAKRLGFAATGHISDLLRVYAGNLEQLVAERTSKLAYEQRLTDKLLLSIMPPSIVVRLKKVRAEAGDEDVLIGFADLVENVTICFTDVVGFTDMSRQMRPQDVVRMLCGLFTQMDMLARRHGVLKIKTIGDAMMVASGLTQRQNGSVERVARWGLELFTDVLPNVRNPDTGEVLRLRAGMHTGPVVAGIVPSTTLAFDAFGDTVNLASRMESNGVPDRVCCSGPVHDALKDEFDFIARPPVTVKGQGSMVTYIVGKPHDPVASYMRQVKEKDWLKTPALQAASALKYVQGSALDLNVNPTGEGAEEVELDDEQTPGAHVQAAEKLSRPGGEATGDNGDYADSCLMVTVSEV